MARALIARQTTKETNDMADEDDDFEWMQRERLAESQPRSRSAGLRDRNLRQQSRLINQMMHEDRVEGTVETGRLLLSLARGHGGNGAVRLTWETDVATPYLAIANGQRDRDGRWWRRGRRIATVRVAELDDLRRAVERAVELAREHAEAERERASKP